MKGNEQVTTTFADGAQASSDFSIFNFQFSIHLPEAAR
jgi:hypothetical protein